MEKILSFKDFIKNEKESAFISKPIAIEFLAGKEMVFRIEYFYNIENEDDIYKIDMAIKNFLNLDLNYRAKLTDLVYKNYEDYLHNTNMDPLKLESKEDIWKFFYPKHIYISKEKDGMYIQVSGDCEWEYEHGLQFIFRNGNELTRISDIDGHITQSEFKFMNSSRAKRMGFILDTIDI